MTTTTTAFRSAVHAEVESWRAAEFPDLPVFYENGPEPDQAAVGPAWLDVSIRWKTARLLTVGDGHGPRGRETGVISLQLYHKEAEGTALPDAVMDSLDQRFKARRLGGAVLYQPACYPPTNALGWHKTGLMVEFTLDRN